MLKLYYPYESDKPTKKFFIITNEGKRVYFGATGFEHYTEGHLDEQRKSRYIKRHMKNEYWNNPNKASYWSRWFLWEYPTYKKAYAEIQKEIKRMIY